MNNLSTVLAAMLAKCPGVVVGKKLNSTNFTIKKKVFAFTKGDTVVMKLPQDTIKRLLDAGTATRLVMGKRVMKEWIVLQRPNPGDFKKDLGLFHEAMVFVSPATTRK